MLYCRCRIDYLESRNYEIMGQITQITVVVNGNTYEIDVTDISGIGSQYMVFVTSGKYGAQVTYCQVDEEGLKDKINECVLAVTHGTLSMKERHQ